MWSPVSRNVWLMALARAVGRRGHVNPTPLSDPSQERPGIRVLTKYSHMHIFANVNGEASWKTS